MQFFNLHTHKFSDNSNVLELVNQYPWQFDQTIPNYSIGIHPWYIDQNRAETDLAIIDQKLQLPNCLALGECGLDKRIEISINQQVQIFIAQMQLAQKHNKPIIIHCVAAFDELIAIKNQYNITVPIIIHGFSKNKQLAQQLIKNGFYLSFGKYLVQNRELETVFTSIPNNKFFLETDTIEQTIEQVYTIAANYKKIQVTDLQEIIKNNYNMVFEKSNKPII